MKNRILFSVFFALLVATPVISSAKNSNYVFRSRANWVKLMKLSNKQLAGVELKHPNNEVNADQMEAMLLSLSMNKGSLFKKGVKTSEVFSIEEAKKYSPFIVEALNQAEPNQVVNVAIVHNRSYFVMKNDFLSMMNIFVADDGVHFYFTKIYAKLGSDYEQASKMDTAISKAKGVRVSLDAQPGQTLSSDADEVVMDVKYDFAANVHRAVPTQEEYRIGNDNNEPVKTAKNSKYKSKNKNVTKDDSYDYDVNTQSNDVTTRLKNLENLKKQKLISDAEYRQKRQEILGAI